MAAENQKFLTFLFLCKEFKEFNILFKLLLKGKKLRSQTTKWISSLFLLVITLITGVIVLIEFSKSNKEFENCGISLSNTDTNPIGGELNLLTADGKYITDKEILDKITLVYFGYTYCPDVCPFDLVRNATALDLLDEKDIEINLVFITIDPERDNPKIADEFAKFFHPNAIGLGGTVKDITKAKEKYLVYAAKTNPEKDVDYLMNHSTFTYLMHPKHGFLTFFNRKATALEISEKVKCVLEKT